MKLASLKDGRDGRLVVVSRNLERAVPVPEIAACLQQALDRWAECAPRLQQVAEDLEADRLPEAAAFDPAACAAPLPRAHQWADGSAYLHHVELVRRARGAEMPEAFHRDPLLYQGGSDRLSGPCDDIVAGSVDWGIDFEGEVAVVTDDVAMGTDPSTALERIRLLMLVNDVSLRNLIPGELGKGFGFYQSKPASAFSPVAITPDEAGDAWCDGRLRGALLCHWNGDLFGRPDAGVGMSFGFDGLLSHAARTRDLGAGSILGSGTVSNPPETGVGPDLDAGGVGQACIAERRSLEMLRRGAPETPFMRHGDRIRMEMRAADGTSLFGAIDQRVRVTGSR